MKPNKNTTRNPHPTATKNEPVSLKLYGRTLQTSATEYEMDSTCHRSEKEARSKLNHLKVICRWKGGANPDTALKVYQSFNRPLFEYAAPTCCNSGTTQFKKIPDSTKHCHKNVFCYRMPKQTRSRYTHLCFGLFTLEERLATLGKKHLRRAKQIPSLSQAIGEERKNTHKYICSTPLSVLLKN